MKGFNANLEKETLRNKDFRRVLYTGRHSQIVLMRLSPGEEIGMETHPKIDQFFRFESGTGKVFIDRKTYAVKDGSAIIVPAGARHNVVNSSRKSALLLYTIYSPPEHIDKTVRKTRAEAIARPEEFDGKTTE